MSISKNQINRLLLLCKDVIDEIDYSICTSPLLGNQPLTRTAREDVLKFAILLMTIQPNDE